MGSCPCDAASANLNCRICDELLLLLTVIHNDVTAGWQFNRLCPACLHPNEYTLEDIELSPCATCHAYLSQE